MLSKRRDLPLPAFSWMALHPKSCAGGDQRHSMGIAMMDCSPLTVYAVTITGVFAAMGSLRPEASPCVTVILALCKSLERKSATEAFKTLPVSTEHLLSEPSTSQARNTKPVPTADRSSRIVLLAASALCCSARARSSLARPRGSRCKFARNQPPCPRDSASRCSAALANLRPQPNSARNRKAH